MKALCFSTHKFEKSYLNRWAEHYGLNLKQLETRLTVDTVELTRGYDCICCWANDDLSADVLKALKANSVKMISLRSAGFSHIDINLANELGFTITRVPAYSPQAIAEHCLGLLMCLNRKFLKAFQRVREFNFTLDGLEGTTLYGKTAGVIGVGKIGESFARIMNGMGCKVLLCDPAPKQNLTQELNAEYVDLIDLLERSDIISLHCPLNKQTKHLLNSDSFKHVKKGAFLLNTGRGALIETGALIDKLKKKELRGVGLDVYEHEEDVFFHDFSEEGISDEKLLRLMTFPNVLITSHQAFFTQEALDNIAKISLGNIASFLSDGKALPENTLTN